MKLPRLASDINEMFNKKANLTDILTHILANSNFYKFYLHTTHKNTYPPITAANVNGIPILVKSVNLTS